MDNATIYKIVQQVPSGWVITYGQIAAVTSSGPRQIGRILHLNPDPESCPCHRVVRHDGSIASGYAFGGALAQISKLEQEGIVFNGEKIVNFEQHLFDLPND